MKRAVKKIVVAIAISAMIIASIPVGIFAAGKTVDLTFTSADTIEKSEYYANTLVGTVTFNADSKETPLVISDDAFYGCKNLTSAVFTGVGDIVISDRAFSECTALENVVFDIEGTLTIRQHAFSYCTALTDISSLYALEKVIIKGGHCFLNTGLKEARVSSNMVFEQFFADITDEHYGRYSNPTRTFALCTSLEKAVVEQNLPHKYYATLSGSPYLKYIYIAPQVTELDESIFYSFYDDYKQQPVIYGYSGTVAEEYSKNTAKGELFKFVPVDKLNSESITYTQSVKGEVGEAVPVTVSVLGYPDKITTKDSICATTIAREDAEIVTTDTGEVWTFDVTPYSETEKITLTASYCGEDITVSKDIEVVAEAPAEVLSPVSSAKTVNPAVTGSFAQVAVTVSGKADKIRFVSEDSATTTYIREDAKYITDNKNGTETWLVNVSVRKAADNFTIYASYAETGWISKGLAYTLESKAYNTTNEVKAVSLPDGEDGVIYCGVNTLEIVTSDDTVKVQLMKDSNTWTFSEANATYTDENGMRKWTLKMNFSQLGDQIYNIRVRNTKSAFVTVDQLPVTVYAD